jgi:Protein of unknown function, DUF547
MRWYILLWFVLQSCMLTAQLNNQSSIRLSQQILLAAKTGESTDSLQLALQNLSINNLQMQLQADADKKTFWLNIYNAYTQLLLQKNPDAYQNRNRFFTSKQIIIAGKKFSLDIIEHGILRRSKVKLGLGYLTKLFPPSLEKKLRVHQLDYRIHFALNCGAKSCPPIAFYDADKIDEQLMLAEKSFIKNDCSYDAAANIAEVSKIFSWFRGDFGGKKGIIALLKRQGIVTETAKPGVKFKPYNWALALKYYSE